MNNAQQLQDAERLQQAGRMPEAARAYSELLRTEPANFHALYQLGLILFQYRQFADADRLFHAATRVIAVLPVHWMVAATIWVQPLVPEKFPR